MKSLILPLITGLFGMVQTLAQLPEKPIGTIANSLLCVPLDPKVGWNTWNNPSLLSGVTQSKISLYQEIPHMQTAMALSAVGVEWKWRRSGFGLQFTQTGNSYFRQQVLSGGMGLSLLENLKAGVSLHMLLTQQYQQPALMSVYGTVAMSLQINPTLSFSNVWVNMNQAMLGPDSKERLSWVLRNILNYHLTDNLSAVGELDVSSIGPISTRLGLHLKYSEKAEFAFGASLRDGFGFSGVFRRSKTRLSIGVRYLPTTGNSPFSELQWEK